jgi:ComF family protein
MAHLIQRWKYHRQRELTALLAQLWVSQLAQLPQVDAMIPVPLHWRRLLGRGFNQATLLSWQLQREHPALQGVPILCRGVSRSRYTQAQPGMGAGGRLRNLDHAFTAQRRYDNLRLAIVDDVMTTGATAEALAGTLLQAGAADVQLWCLARTPAPGWQT